jgi:hypothetical protein
MFFELHHADVCPIGRACEELLTDALALLDVAHSEHECLEPILQKLTRGFEPDTRRGAGHNSGFGRRHFVDVSLRRVSLPPTTTRLEYLPAQQ